MAPGASVIAAAISAELAADAAERAAESAAYGLRAARDGETMHAFVARLAQAEADAARLQSLYDRSHDWQQHDALLDALRQAAEALAWYVEEEMLREDNPRQIEGRAALAAIRKVLGGAP